jgi:uncharacterized protein YeaO (DUF488 family)
MLKQAAVSEVKDCSIPRKGSHIVITMRFYPRFLKKELRDEFVCDLAPVKELLHDFNQAQKKLGDHNPSFAQVDYENRFDLSESGMEHLKRLSDLSKNKDVYLVCICGPGERCHREMLMLMAQHLYHCKIGKVFHSYPDFMKRVPKLAK